METAIPPTTIKSTFASARITNSFSNEGSIIDRRFPVSLSYELGIETKHFKTLKKRKCREATSNSFL
jgi:hypothetical protein